MHATGCSAARCRYSDETERQAFDDQNRGNLDTDALQRAIEANSLAAQVELFGGPVQLPSNPENRSFRSVPVRGGTIARAFWWGFHIQVSHADVLDIISAVGSTATIIAILTPVVPPVVRPFLAIARLILDTSKAVLRALDRGHGVYISMTWFAPGVFVPTTVV